MTTDLVDYYRRRAGEYERIYAKPERQADLRRLKEIVAEAMRGKRVLEVACGTGYWTETIAGVAAGVEACDVNETVLEIARAKSWDAGTVTFWQADAYALPESGAAWDAGFAGFWWSHVPRGRRREFLAGMQARLARGATVMFIDSRYVAGSSTPIARRDADGNTFQVRRLEDGSVHEVLKNFPTPDELREAVTGMRGVSVTETEFFWVLRYELT